LVPIRLLFAKNQLREAGLTRPMSKNVLISPERSLSAPRLGDPSGV
jgi:hypothetical protein